MLLGLVAAHPYAALFALVLAEEAGVPLPISGDLLLIYAGYLIVQGDVQLAPLIGVVLSASAAGALVPYGLARAGGLGAVRRFGRIVHLSAARLARLERWLKHNRGWAIVLTRQVPGGRVPTSIVAGAFRVPVAAFLAYTVFGALLWAATWLFLGVCFGTHLLQAMRQETPWLAIVLAGGVALYLAFRFSRRVARRSVG